MSDKGDPLSRIADALERLAGSTSGPTDWLSAPAYVWTGANAYEIAGLEAPRLDQLRGIDRQKSTVTENVARFAKGAAAHDMLLWGARGMGKSALLRAAVIAAQAERPGALAMVQVGIDALNTVPRLFAELGPVKRHFLVFIDDLGFADDDRIGPRHLRSWLEGGLEARPASVRLGVTSNRRNIAPRHASDQDDLLNSRDTVDDNLALADRFGLSVGFHACSQSDYLEIVSAYADPRGIEWKESDALEWAKRRGARSGRTAWHYVTELAGRAGQRL